MKHLLVTNDFPPKIGGIQTYLWELWRRLPPEDVVVLTTDHDGAAEWDAEQAFPVHRWPRPIMWPTPALERRVQRLADQHGVDLVLFDPVVPVGVLALRLDRPYGVVVHGAELVFPAASPVYQLAPRQVLRGARVVIAAGGYPAAGARRSAGRPVPTIEVPPGVDAQRFVPLDAPARRAARERFGIDPDAPVILSVSRLVPRKGMDVLLQAATRLAERHDGLQVVIAGDGRDRGRLDRLATELRAPVRFLGPVANDDLPALYGCADVFAMLCRERWGGLEQEGFGIVFLEAAASGVPQVAGRSGGSHEAVAHGETGFVIDHPTDVEEVTAALHELLADDQLRRRMGDAARRRAVDAFDHDALAEVLRAGLARVDVGAERRHHDPSLRAGG